MLQCPAQCGRKRRVGQLLCVRCWKRLPARLRGPLYSDWKASQRDLSNDLLWRRYQQSRRIALAALR